MVIIDKNGQKWTVKFFVQKYKSYFVEYYLILSLKLFTWKKFVILKGE